MNQENVKVLTKGDVIHLSNDTKRKEFLADYHEWGVWLDIPELNVKIFKAVLPNEHVIFVTQFKQEVYSFQGVTSVYRYGTKPTEYGRYAMDLRQLTEILKDLKVQYVKERKAENVQ